MQCAAQNELENADILVNLGKHLVRLADDTAQVTRAVSEIIQSQPRPLSATAILDLQKLDYLEQSLRDAAQLSAALALTGPDRAGALAFLQMCDTRNLLNTTSTDASDFSKSIELF